MSQVTSKLWSRRKTSGAHEIPLLSPLYSTALIPTSAYPIDCIPTPPFRPPISSPAMYTPTEAIGILLGQSPMEAAHSTRLAVDSITANLPFLSPRSEQHYYYHSSPCSPFLDRYRFSDTTPSQERSGYLASPVSNLQEDFNFDIDTAALATEVALQVLSSADCFGEPDEPPRMRKMRLLLPWDHTITSETHQSLSPTQSHPVEKENGLPEKPIRKGRARMSQEKRKRMARRKEREALMLGIPPKPVSAPPHIHHFPSLPSNQIHPNKFGWKQPRKLWTQDFRRPSNLSPNRSGSVLEESSSRCSSISTPSLDTDASSTSTSFSPMTSPECYRRSLHQGYGADHGGQGWESNSQITSVPKLSLQPPSPQQCRTSAPRYLSVVPFNPSGGTSPPPQQTTAPATMRWSTTQGLMTSQGVSLAGPRADFFWPQIFSNLDSQPSTKSESSVGPL